jgi:hypothetical protein
LSGQNVNWLPLEVGRRQNPGRPGIDALVAAEVQASG